MFWAVIFMFLPQGVLPYICLTGMCRPKGYGFWADLVWKRVLPLPILVWVWVWFLRDFGGGWTYLSFEFQINKKEREICELETDFRKSFCWRARPHHKFPGITPPRKVSLQFGGSSHCSWHSSFDLCRDLLMIKRKLLSSCFSSTTTKKRWNYLSLPSCFILKIVLLRSSDVLWRAIRQLLISN